MLKMTFSSLTLLLALSGNSSDAQAKLAAPNKAPTEEIEKAAAAGIKHLETKTLTLAVLPSQKALEHLASIYPNLESLSIGFPSSILNEKLTQILLTQISHMKNIKKLSFFGNINDALLKTIKHPITITDLSIIGKVVNETGLFTKVFPNLQQLNIPAQYKSSIDFTSAFNMMESSHLKGMNITLEDRSKDANTGAFDFEKEALIECATIFGIDLKIQTSKATIMF